MKAEERKKKWARRNRIVNLILIVGVVITFIYFNRTTSKTNHLLEALERSSEVEEIVWHGEEGSGEVHGEAVKPYRMNNPIAYTVECSKEERRWFSRQPTLTIEYRIDNRRLYEFELLQFVGTDEERTYWSQKVGEAVPPFFEIEGELYVVYWPTHRLVLLDDVSRVQRLIEAENALSVRK